jgi:hypothetical protein
MIILLLVFILVITLTIRNHDGKSSLLSPILATFFVLGIFAFFAIYALDKYTKTARLENIVQKKVLINESFSISGQIRNIGNFTIGSCVLEVKISNELSDTTGSESIVFAPKSVLDNFFRKESTYSVDTTKEFVIAENLHTGEMRNFTVFMRYPPSFAKPYTRYELYCH